MLLPAMRHKLLARNYNKFPIVNLYGQPETGKSTAAHIVSEANGRPVEAIIQGMLMPLAWVLFCSVCVHHFTRHLYYASFQAA